jgi:hypothetical protein
LSPRPLCEPRSIAGELSGPETFDVPPFMLSAVTALAARDNAR